MDLINPSQRRMRRSERITGKYQQAIQAATAAVQGLAGGNLSAALAGGAAPCRYGEVIFTAIFSQLALPTFIHQLTGDNQCQNPDGPLNRKGSNVLKD
ncbi:TPA: hypothetical protein ACHY8A_004837 [Escherichia coli]|nr:hypothetical protein [Escherichia coli]HEF1015371.1 hypothetical protein [Escherichia coli]